jgi:hypothetical protein
VRAQRTRAREPEKDRDDRAALPHQPYVDLERAAQDLGVAPARLERLFDAGQLQDPEAVEQLLGLQGRSVGDAQLVKRPTPASG